jgi:hypothetical protein
VVELPRALGARSQPHARGLIPPEPLPATQQVADISLSVEAPPAAIGAFLSASPWGKSLRPASPYTTASYIEVLTLRPLGGMGTVLSTDSVSDHRARSHHYGCVA